MTTTKDCWTVPAALRSALPGCVVGGMDRFGAVMPDARWWVRSVQVDRSWSAPPSRPGQRPPARRSRMGRTGRTLVTSGRV